MKYFLTFFTFVNTFCTDANMTFDKSVMTLKINNDNIIKTKKLPMNKKYNDEDLTIQKNIDLDTMPQNQEELNEYRKWEMQHTYSDNNGELDQSSLQARKLTCLYEYNELFNKNSNKDSDSDTIQNKTEYKDSDSDTTQDDNKNHKVSSISKKHKLHDKKTPQKVKGTVNHTTPFVKTVQQKKDKLNKQDKKTRKVFDKIPELATVQKVKRVSSDQYDNWTDKKTLQNIDNTIYPKPDNEIKADIKLKENNLNQMNHYYNDDVVDNINSIPNNYDKKYNIDSVKKVSTNKKHARNENTKNKKVKIDNTKLSSKNPVNIYQNQNQKNNTSLKNKKSLNKMLPLNMKKVKTNSKKGKSIIIT